MTVSGPPPGWYPHPTMAQTQRYWDGFQWTDHIAPAAVPVPASAPASQVSDGLLAAGYITAILIPIIGFVVGIVVMAKGRSGHGIAMIIISIVAFVMWADALTPEPTYYTPQY